MGIAPAHCRKSEPRKSRRFLKLKRRRRRESSRNPAPAAGANALLLGPPRPRSARPDYFRAGPRVTERGIRRVRSSLLASVSPARNIPAGGPSGVSVQPRRQPGQRVVGTAAPRAQGLHPQRLPALPGQEAPNPRARERKEACSREHVLGREVAPRGPGAPSPWRPRSTSQPRGAARALSICPSVHPGERGRVYPQRRRGAAAGDSGAPLPCVCRGLSLLHV